MNTSDDATCDDVMRARDSMMKGAIRFRPPEPNFQLFVKATSIIKGKDS